MKRLNINFNPQFYSYILEEILQHWHLNSDNLAIEFLIKGQQQVMLMPRFCQVSLIVQLLHNIYLPQQFFLLSI